MFRVNVNPTGFDRVRATGIMQENQDKVDGKIFTHTAIIDGKMVGAVACYVRSKTDAHYIAYEIETTIPCKVTVEETV